MNWKKMKHAHQMWICKVGIWCCPSKTETHRLWQCPSTWEEDDRSCSAAELLSLWSAFQQIKKPSKHDENTYDQPLNQFNLTKMNLHRYRYRVNVCSTKEWRSQVARPERDSCGSQDDMWFVGIIFYQLITGQPFFQMDSDELESMDEQGATWRRAARLAAYRRLRSSFCRAWINKNVDVYLALSIINHFKYVSFSDVYLRLSAISGFCWPWDDAMRCLLRAASLVHCEEIWKQLLGSRNVENV